MTPLGILMSQLDTVTTSATQSVNQATAVGTNLSSTFQQGVGTIQGGVNDLAGDLSSLGLSIQTSIQGGIQTITDKFKSEFANLPAPPAAPTITPQQVMARASGGKADHVFPSDIGDYFILFSFYEYVRPSATVVATKKKTTSIALPLPQNLTENFLMQYEQVDMGQIVATVQNSAEGGVVQGTAGDVAKEAAKAALVNPNAGQKAFGALAGTGVARDSVNAIQQSGGFAPNPHIGLMFRGVNIRAPHQFVYRLSPKNINESIEIREIVRKLKYMMHPSLQAGSFNFNFPDLCDITIKRPTGEDYKLFKYKPAFLESMNVNYAPNGVPTFFAGTRHPTDIEITMVFKEAQIFTREDFTTDAMLSDDVLPTTL